jgi:hypothetical protein
MSFQWLTMRIGEETDRRRREAQVLERLPRALEELHKYLKECIDDYRKAFGPESVETAATSSRVHITVREQRDGKWEPASKIEILVDTLLPGFKIDRAGLPLTIEVGILPGDKLYFRDSEQDQYVTTEEVTRRILDRGLFPKLPQ